MNLPKIFQNYLIVEGYSSVSIRNYLSDLNHFLSWFELKLRGQNLPVFPEEKENISCYFTPKIVEAYKNFLLENKLPASTINRRLSTLRLFAKFCRLQNLIRENPTKNLKNQAKTEVEVKEETLLQKFKEFLREEKTSTGRQTSSNTIKSYLSDINSFLAWLKVST